ncbi:hypothetical protein NKDENANG_01312 [Candidatus Entotheonellaceae bacterium PAL068K]
MFTVWYGIAIVLALLLQTSPLLVTVGSSWRVDWTLLIVVYLSLYQQGHRILVLGFLSGLLQDALSSEVLGLHALSKTLTGFVVYTLSRNVQVHSLIVQGLFTGLAVLIDALGRGLVLFIFLQLHAFDAHFFLGTLAQQIVLSLCVVPFVCRGLHALAKGLHIHQGKA